jgi:ABC-type polysaccharide/polyol phosphate transport system ATPase subunit
MAVAIRVRDVSKAYPMFRHPRHRLLEAVTFGHLRYHEDFWALRDVSLTVEHGATLGIVGANGSGKSTLLQIIAGIVRATTGTVTTDGRIAALLELGAGFSPEFTGRENIIMYGAIMGMSRAEILKRLPAVEAFADIGGFIDRPVRTYSSGMFVRLAFAAAIHVEPDILLVDEALAVGDAAFQHRCISRIKEFQRQGKTIVFVSHDMGLVKAICTEAALLHRGRLVRVGSPAEIVNYYHGDVSTAAVGRSSSAVPAAPRRPHARFRPDPGFDRRAGLFRHGSGAARIRNVELLDAADQPVTLVPFGSEVTLRVHVEFYEDVPFSILGFYFRDKNGVDLVGTNTNEEGQPLPARRAGDTLVVDFRQPVPLQPGPYSVSTAIAYSPTQPLYLDWVDNALVFEVLPPGPKHIHAKVWLPVTITIHA